MKKSHLFLFLPLVLLSFNAKADNSFNISHSADRSSFAKSIDIGQGRHLYLRCSGKGSPTVILESGYRNDSDVWTVSIDKKQAVFPAVASFTHVCVYDRPGTIGWTVNANSRSDAIPMPRSVESVTNDLHALLQAANVKGPYILVGHSLGGIFVRLYASKYPNDVVGLILVDAYSENFRSLLGSNKWKIANGMMKAMPEGIKLPGNFEMIDFDEVSNVMQKTAANSPLKPMPLIVLSRGKAADLYPQSPELTSADFEKAWRAAQNQLVALEPNTPHIIADKSQHYIQYFQPQLIIESIKTMVNQIRLSTHPSA